MVHKTSGAFGSRSFFRSHPRWFRPHPRWFTWPSDVFPNVMSSCLPCFKVSRRRAFTRRLLPPGGQPHATTGPTAGGVPRVACCPLAASLTLPLDPRQEEFPGSPTAHSSPQGLVCSHMSVPPKATLLTPHYRAPLRSRTVSQLQF